MTAVLPPQNTSYGTDTGIGSGDSFFDDTPASPARSPPPGKRSPPPGKPSPPPRKETMSGGKTHSRSRSDSYTDASYSDSFDSESETRTPTPTRAAKKKGKRASSESSPRKDKVSSSNSNIFITRTRRWPSSSSLTSAKTTVVKHHVGSRGPRYRPQSLQNTPRPHGQGDIVTRRMLSARRVKIKDLTSQIFQLQQELDDLKRENKLLKTLQHKQEKALTRFEDQESDLPQLLARHSAEVRNLKERLRHKQDSNHRSEQKIKDLRDEVERKEHQLNKLQKIVRDKNLAERDELNRKLMRTEQMLWDKEKKVAELSKHLELVQSSSTRQLNTERARHKDTQDKLDKLQEEYERLQHKLKEKEKELDIKNIYSNRLKVGGSKAPSVDNTPRKPKAPHKTTGTVTEESKENPFFLTSQLNDSFEEERRRREEEERKERERQEWDREERERRQREEREQTEREREQREREARERDLQLQLDRDRRDREVEERERMARLMKERLSQGDESHLAKDLQRAEDDRRKEEQRERERKEREERERQRAEQERRAKEERQRREREEQEQREREAAERRAREEAARLENDIAAKEEQRKKALLLARLKAIDQGDDPDVVTDTPVQNGPVRELKRQSSIGSRSDSGKSRKEWNFRKPDENLHNGLPSHEKDDDLTFGGYAPTFGTRKSKEPAKKNVAVIQFNDEFASKKQDAGKNKSNLMEALFGETDSKLDKKQSSFGEDDIFSSSTKAKPVKDRSAYPWEKEVNVAGKGKATKHEPTSTLYGGGSAIVDEEPKPITSKDSPFLPRRPRRENSFGNKPAINAVDSFDDEIEEVIL